MDNNLTLKFYERFTLIFINNRVKWIIGNVQFALCILHLVRL